MKRATTDATRKRVPGELVRLARSKGAYDAEEARWLLEGSVYQVAMTICERCGRGTRDGAGRELAVEDHEVEAALCDAQHIGCTHVDEPAAATQDIPPRIRRLVVRRAHGRCEVPGCRAPKHLEIHHIVPRAQGGTHDPSNLLLTARLTTCRSTMARCA